MIYYGDMKKLYFSWCVLILCILVYSILHHLPRKVSPRLEASPVVLASPTTQPLVRSRTPTSYLFVPYWSFDAKPLTATYSGYVYFGIIPTADGIDTKDSSYTKIATFTSVVPPQKEKFLAIQMVDASINEQMLHDMNLQKKIIDQSLEIATSNGFSGIVLDFEYSALAFDSVTKTTTQLMTNFAQTTHLKKKKFYATIYGDVFYRLRPYDVATIGKQADGVFVMAYDFHKASGDPGANFPFQKDSNDDYDFMHMVADFTKQVSVPKLTVVFGMFGYDWKVNSKGQSITTATALSINQIQQSILPACLSLHCQIQHNKTSLETQVSYIDKQQINHILWYEDIQSSQAKQTYLRTNGIQSYAYWANGYF